MTSNQGNLTMKTCWGREQLQRETVKGKLQEEDKVNYHHPDPARQAGWQKPGRHVTNQVRTGSQKEVGCVYTPSSRGGPDPHETPRVTTWRAAPLRRWSAVVQVRGENKQSLLTRSQPRALAVTARGSDPPPSQGSAGLAIRHRRPSQTRGLRLRKSRPGTRIPAPQLTAPAQPSSQGRPASPPRVPR